MKRCLLVSPRFSEYSYWNFRDTCEIIGAKYLASPLGLITVAALLPQDWEIRLLDLNVQEMDEALFDWADIVMTGGMITQQRSLLSLIDLCHEHGKRVVVGGQDPTSQPDVYASADFLVLNEGELTIPGFLADLQAGAARGVYRSEEKADMTLSPAPRFDLLDLNKYLYIGIQFSRGCPFHCEFCDVIELYGRRPRTKTAAQVLRELERLYELGRRGHVDFVDDNFIGNKKNAMAVLPEILDWSRKRRHPFYFSTEATLNLADDPKLLDLMEALDFRYVFIGIETPEKDLLAVAHKKGNARHPIVESIHTINRHGMNVIGAFIVGFDGENRANVLSIASCVEAAGIPMVLVGLLTALPNTQMTHRLAREGRLPEDYSIIKPGDVDQTTSGLNFATLRPRVEILMDYASIIRKIYSPENYFRRVWKASSLLHRKPRHSPSIRRRLAELVSVTRIVRRLGFKRETARHFWPTLLQIALMRPRNLDPCLHLMAVFLHYRKQSLFVLERTERQIAQLCAEEPVEQTPRFPAPAVLPAGRELQPVSMEED